MSVRLPRPSQAAADKTPGSSGRFRFSFSAMDRYRGSADNGEPPLFRRWEAVGLLLVVTVGAAFVPGTGGEAPVGTILIHAAERGDLRARFFSFAPPLLAFLFAMRASNHLVRPFRRVGGVLVTATLASASVFLAFQIGVYLALETVVAGTPLRGSPWVLALPGALAGWALLVVVAAIRLLARRAAHDLEAARAALKGESSPDAGPLPQNSREE